MRYFLTALVLFLSCSTLPEDVSGCTNPSACNFNTDANEDDGSCAYLDCLENCGGDAYLDPCGYCDSDTENDCAVECGAIIEQISIDEEEFQCENEITEGGYNCNDLTIILNIMNSNPHSLYSDMDVDSNNVITVYEYGLQQWSNGRLTSLNLTYNENVVMPTFCNFRLTTLPENIGDLSALKKLSLTNNELTSLPGSITNLISLEQLLLGSNQLTSLPDDFGNLINLKKLNLNSNQIEQLPATFGNLILLEHLWVNHNQLVYLPESIGNLLQLEWLYIKNNLLQSIPESIGNLESLRIINIDNNKLLSLPESLCTETDGMSFYGGMQSFSMTNNYICSDIAEYEYPLCLEAILENGGSQICEDCPPNYFFIENYCAWSSDFNILQEFLDLNPESQSLPNQTGVPDSANQIVNEEWWDSGRLVEIDFHHKQLNSIIPENIGDLDKLKILRLNGNQLKGAIPDNITNLDNLKILKLNSNNLSENIPEDIGELNNLDTLFLSNNNLTGEIPSSITEIDSLTYLDLNNNNLTGAIPEGIGSIDSLRYIFLYNNQLGCYDYDYECDPMGMKNECCIIHCDDTEECSGKIPPDIGNLVNLKRLYLYNNNLSGQIPESICTINDLKMYLENNRLCPGEGGYPTCFPEYQIDVQDTSDCP